MTNNKEINNREILEKIHKLLKDTTKEEKLKKLFLLDKYDSFDSILNNLGKLRKERGITLREAEKRTGISNSYISQIEQGKAKLPNLTQINKLLKAYGVSISQLFVLDFINNLIGDDTMEVKDLQPGAAYIVRRYQQLSLENKKILTIILDALLQKERLYDDDDEKNSYW